MKIQALFIIRKGWEQNAELAAAWDEFSIEGYPEGWDEAKADALKGLGSDLLAHRVFEIEVDEEEIAKEIMDPRTVIPSKIKPLDG